MADSTSNFRRASAAIAFLGVALGALGAHFFKARLTELGHVDVWKTAALYHLLHAVVLYVLSLDTEGFRRRAWMCMAFGILLFSGSLYALALTNIGAFGPITPLGGILFLFGWGMLVRR